MPMPAEDAYWQVAGNTTQVWASKRIAYVPPTDAAYQAWLAAGHRTIAEISEASLSQTLNDLGLPHLAPIPSLAAVDMERDRRNNRGQQLTLKTGKVVSLATATRQDFDNINFAADTALTLIAKTIPGLADEIDAILPDPRAPTPGTMTVRDFYRKPVTFTYHEMAETEVRITDNIVAVNKAAHELKDLYPNIPRDYKADSHWPNIPLPPNTPPP